MSLSTTRASSAPSSSREERADVTDLDIQVPDQEIRKKEPLPEIQSSIPQELMLTLTSTVSSRNMQGYTAHHRNCESCEIRRPDGIWHHPHGRSKYKYFLEQPTTLTGAGRDISFLCDAVLTQRKMSLLPPVNEKSSNEDTQNLDLSENVVPEEYRIVRNKGIRRLELYEDAFTVQLTDQEQKLRALPSLRPSGRLEVIQLMSMMDDMLEKAGVDQQSEELTDLCQLEGLLELVKTEQNIYNIVFHELIRQVTVGCAERGQLLAKLRQRYQSLLDRIPRRLRSLHTEVVAQRALDRRIIEEIYRIKMSIQQINMELSKIRDHDGFITEQLERAQQQLNKSYRETLCSLDIVQGYHHLYELHRARLEDQLQQITENRDYWTQFTFNLALKVIKVKQLQLVSELHTSEKGWSQTAQHCLFYISTKDAQDLDGILEKTSHWKEQLIALISQVKSTENTQFAQVTSLHQGITKWSLFLNTQNKSPGPEYDKSTVEEIHADLRHWSHVLVLHSEEYQGEKQFLILKRVKELRTTMENWLSMSTHLFERHTSPDDESPMCPKTIRELDSVLSELLKQSELHVSEDNEIHKLNMSLVKSMECWIFQTSFAMKQADPLAVISASDWLELEEAMFNWQNFAEEMLSEFSIAQAEDRRNKNKYNLYTETTRAIDMVKEFTKNLSNFSEIVNQKLQEKVASLHIGQDQWMLDLLLLLIPNQSEEGNEDLNHDYIASSSLQALLEDAKSLSEKMVYFTSIINRSCYLILDEKMTVDPNETENKCQRNQFQKLQNDCDNWVESCKILYTGICKRFEEQLIKQPEESSSSTESPESMETQATEEPLMEPEHVGENRDEIEPESTESKLIDHESPVLKLIGYDGNITQRNLDESHVQLAGTDELVLSPETEEANRAFKVLTTAVLLQQELSDAEVRMRIFEQRALKAEEALYEALNKIQDLERQLKRQSAPEPQSEDEAKKTPPPSPPTATSPASPKSPTAEASITTENNEQ